MKYELNGFVIVMPINPWDKKHADSIIPRMSYRGLFMEAIERHNKGDLK